MYGVEIKGPLDCQEGVFQNRTENGEAQALNMEGSRISGSVLLRKGFTAEGRIWMNNAELGSWLDCHDGTISNCVPSQWLTQTSGLPKRAALAISFSNARVNGPLWLAKSDDGPEGPATIGGSIDLEGAHVRLLVDEGGWPAREQTAADGTILRCEVLLDNFTFDRLASFAPTDAKSRLAWLGLQPDDHLDKNFRPQPYQHLAKVLTDMGHADEARIIRREAQWRQRRAERLRAADRSFFAALWGKAVVNSKWLVLDVALGGGLSILRPVVTALLLMAGFGAIYQHGMQTAGFVPSQSALWTSEEARRLCAGRSTYKPEELAPVDWLNCEAPPRELPAFNPWIYSLETMLPLSTVWQKAHWRPRSAVVERLAYVPGSRPVQLLTWSWLEFATWAQTLIALVLYSIIIAMVAGWIKRE
jgi:hypothetical protein